MALPPKGYLRARQITRNITEKTATGHRHQLFSPTRATNGNAINTATPITRAAHTSGCLTALCTELQCRVRSRWAGQRDNPQRCRGVEIAQDSALQLLVRRGVEGKGVQPRTLTLLNYA
jgi:hypothetical protein